MEENNNPKVPVTDLPIFQFLRQKYEPVTNPTDATLMLSTMEVLRQIAKHTGADGLTLEVVYTWLKENGFQDDSIGELNFVWYMKEIEW
jgi:hypothetical protein